MPQRGREKSLTPADFDALRETLHAAAKTMSREQIVELADDLFDCSRERRDLHSWRRQPPTSSHTN